MLRVQGKAVKLNPGDVIEQKYQIVRVLGAGGMGAVYEATNLRVGRRVAIKVMHDALDPGAVARFEREARAAQIGSPYIVQVHDLGYLADNAPYMVMEYLSGESLGQRLERQGRLRPSEMLPIAMQVLEALGAAHRAGIIHRDLKPDNVFLARPEGDEREVVKLVDFGISKVVGGTLGSDTPSLTRTGVAVGTPHYMSPEQVQGSKNLDGRSDLYSMGVMIYRCLSARLPFNADEIAPLLVAILLEAPTPLREIAPDVDRELSAIVMRAMARRAEDRYQTAAEFLADLANWETTHRGSLDAVSASSGMTSATRTSLIGTASSWASSAAETQTVRKKMMRVGLLVGVFSFAGLVALLVGFKAWSNSRAEAAAAAAAEVSASAAALAATPAPALAPAPAPTVASAPMPAAPTPTVAPPSSSGAIATPVKTRPPSPPATSTAKSTKPPAGSGPSVRHVFDRI